MYLYTAILILFPAKIIKISVWCRMGLEPMTSGSTFGRSDRLNYQHHIMSVQRIILLRNRDSVWLTLMYLREDSNLYLRFRRPLSFPLDDEGRSDIRCHETVCRIPWCKDITSDRVLEISARLANSIGRIRIYGAELAMFITIFDVWYCLSE